MRISLLAAASAAAIIAAGAASAATVTLNSVSGVWSAAEPGDAVGLGGIGSNELRWGTPGSTGQQSGYDFVGTAPPPVVVAADGSPILLGTFTHLNFPILADPDPSSITGATLDVTYDLDVDGNSILFTTSYSFAHWETPNSANPCADGGDNGVGINDNGCADRVTVVNNPESSQSVVIGKMRYTFNVTGFDAGSNILWTRERDVTSANLFGSITVAAIPLPATGLLLLAGLGGMAAIRRRRKA